MEEVKNLLARDRPLKPRTYRVGANRTIFVGGVCRIDVVEFDYGTVYFTVWASDLIPLHMGKTEVAGKNGEILHKADDFWDSHVGTKLNPPGPYSKHLVPELVPVEVRFTLPSLLLSVLAHSCLDSHLSEFIHNSMSTTSACAMKRDFILLICTLSVLLICMISVNVCALCVQFYVEGTETQVPQSDIAIAGLGWVSCGLRGRAKLRVR